MSKPKVSIVTVCFNAVDTIEETIKSVLAQTYENLEYIVIDFGSTDGTKDILARYADKLDVLISEPDRGIYDAMNKGIRESSGEWINFRNAGDCFVSESVLDAFFAESPQDDVVILHGDCIYINDWGYKYECPSLLKCSYEKEMPVLHPAAFVRSAYHKAHPYDSSYRSSGDYKFFYDCCKSGIKMEYRHIPVAFFRTGGFATLNGRLTHEENARIKGKKDGIITTLKNEVMSFLLRLSRKSVLVEMLYNLNLERKGWRKLPVPADLIP